MAVKARIRKICQCELLGRHVEHSALSVALIHETTFKTRMVIRVTRLGDLLDFGHIFKAFGNN